jgi:hypothetical protein
MPIQHSALIIQHFCNQTCPAHRERLSPFEDSDSDIRRTSIKNPMKNGVFSPIAAGIPLGL